MLTLLYWVKAVKVVQLWTPAVEPSVAPLLMLARGCEVAKCYFVDLLELNFLELNLLMLNHLVLNLQPGALLRVGTAGCWVLRRWWSGW